MSRSIDLLFLAKSDGSRVTDVTHATAGLVLTYCLDGAAAVDCTPTSTLVALTATHTPLGIKHKGYGVYRFDAPDAAFVGKVTFQGETTTAEIIPVIYGKLVEPNDSLADFQVLRILLATIQGKTTEEGLKMYDPSGTSLIVQQQISGNNRTDVTVTPNA